MKKNMKVASFVAAALLAVAPVAGTLESRPAVAASVNKGVTFRKAVDHFDGKRQVLVGDDGHDIDFGSYTISYQIKDQAGHPLKKWKKTLANGQYQAVGHYKLNDIKASAEDRSATLMGVNGNKAEVLAQTTIPANATSISGKIDFSFTVTNGKVSDSSLGSATRTVNGVPAKKSKKTKKHVKKHVRKVVKKRGRKHAKRRNRK